MHVIIGEITFATIKLLANDNGKTVILAQDATNDHAKIAENDKHLTKSHFHLLFFVDHENVPCRLKMISFDFISLKVLVALLLCCKKELQGHILNGMVNQIEGQAFLGTRSSFGLVSS